MKGLFIQSNEYGTAITPKQTRPFTINIFQMTDFHRYERHFSFHIKHTSYNLSDKQISLDSQMKYGSLSPTFTMIQHNQSRN